MLIISSSHWLMHWLLRLGGPGLLLLAQIDNSPIPVPGSMDVLVIILASSRKDLWWYYALMATIGALSAGYFTYRLSAKGGKETFEKKIGKERAQKVYKIFGRYAFLSVFFGALAPPPVPISALLMAAGAMQYPVKKFLAALFLGRAVRYTLIAYLASLYGHALIHALYRYYKPVLIIVIVLGVGGGLVALYYWRKHKRGQKRSNNSKKKEAPIAA
ncbi:MAG TPA: VTT domain-containing protein [Candidatus Koribacter sp.]|jgi:membrane protein YqaA with SNARE-associated domain